jgi:small subunit ribosomal protein S4
VIRRFGTPLPGLTRKETERAYPPGMHGQARKKQPSQYGRRLVEKQKLQFYYGITERQLRRYFEEAVRRRGVTGELMLSMLERRLDNVVFRLGFAPTIPAARQLVTHGHVRIDDRKVDRPAYEVKQGERISLSPKARSIEPLKAAVEQGPSIQVPGYLERDPQDAFSGRVIGAPRREDVAFIVDETAITEFYAQR